MLLFLFPALRKTMLRAHRQAWAWQDEWHGLTMEDIREIEKQTQAALKRKMGDGIADGSDCGEDISDSPTHDSSSIDNSATAVKTFQVALGSIEVAEEAPSPPVVKKSNEMHIHQNYPNNELTLSLNRYYGGKLIQSRS